MERVFCQNEIIKTKTSGIYMFCESLSCADYFSEKYKRSVNLIYLDPPFCTGYDFSQNSAQAYSDKKERSEFINFMRDILVLCRELLSDDGSVYLHIDYRMSAHMRLLLDEIFGESNFRNEIIWSYNSGGRATHHFSRKHDTIFFYSKTDDYYFDITSAGMKRGSQKRNNMKRSEDSDGRVYFSIKSNGREYRYYEDTPIYPTDVWTDIAHLHQRDSERTGYPTQKPLALLNRIISVSSPEGGCACDLFSGSGTLAHAANLSGRTWIAADSSPLALISLKNRLPEGDRESVVCHRTETDTVSVRIEKTGRECVIIPKGSALTYVSVGCIKDGTFYAVQKVQGERVTLPDCPNAALCIADDEGRISFFGN